ncbi:MAG: hypothetical protein ACOC6A_00985, partial [Chloroflexota bacterium]
MKRSRLVWFVMSIALCCGLVMIGLGPQIVSAQSAEEEEQEPPESFELQPKFPVMSGPADTTFEFTVGMNYRGDKARVFEFNISSP